MSAFDNPYEEPIRIAIVGETGCGKSTFINSVIGKDVATVGHGPGTCTDQVKQYGYRLPDGREVFFFDSPGLDGFFVTVTEESGSSSYPSNTGILQMLGEALRNETSGALFSYVFLLRNHSLKEPPLPGKERRLFLKLSGNSLNTIRVISTGWDDADDDHDPVSAFAPVLSMTSEDADSEIKGLAHEGVACLQTGKAFECKRVEGYLHPRQIVHQLLGVTDAPTPSPLDAESGTELRDIIGELKALRDAQQHELSHLRDYTASLSMKCEALLGQGEALTEKLKQRTDELDELETESSNGSTLADAGQPSVSNDSEKEHTSIPGILRSRRERLLEDIKSFTSQLSEEMSAAEREEGERTLEIEALKRAKHKTELALEKPSERQQELRDDKAQLESEREALELELEDLRNRESELSRQLDGEKERQLSWAQRRKGLPDRMRRLQSTLKDLREDIAQREEWIKLVDEEYEKSCEEWEQLTDRIEQLEHNKELKDWTVNTLEGGIPQARERAERLRDQDSKSLEELNFLVGVMNVPLTNTLASDLFHRARPDLEQLELGVGFEPNKFIEMSRVSRDCPGLVQLFQEAFVSMKLKQLIHKNRKEELYRLERQVVEEQCQWEGVVRMISRRWGIGPKEPESISPASASSSRSSSPSLSWSRY